MTNYEAILLPSFRDSSPSSSKSISLKVSGFAFLITTIALNWTFSIFLWILQSEIYHMKIPPLSKKWSLDNWQKLFLNRYNQCFFIMQIIVIFSYFIASGS